MYIHIHMYIYIYIYIYIYVVFIKYIYIYILMKQWWLIVQLEIKEQLDCIIWTTVVYGCKSKLQVILIIYQ